MSRTSGMGNPTATRRRTSVLQVPGNAASPAGARHGRSGLGGILRASAVVPNPLPNAALWRRIGAVSPNALSHTASLERDH